MLRYDRSVPVESVHWALSQPLQWLLFSEKLWSTFESAMVPTCWASDGFCKPVMVSAKAKSEKDQHCNAYITSGTVPWNDVLVAYFNRVLSLVTNTYYSTSLLYFLSVDR